MTPEEQGGKAASEEREAIVTYLDELAAFWRGKAESAKNKACYEAWRGDAYLLTQTAREIRDGAYHEERK